MTKRTPIWDDEQRVREAFDGAQSKTDVLHRLGLPLGSASFLNIKRYAEKYALPLPDGIGAYQTRNTPKFEALPLEEILVERSTYTNRQYLKRRLIRAGLKIDVCEVCGLGPAWHGKELVLQLDHINGVGDDNRLENLRIICPNCHAQTDTFGGPKSMPRGVTGST